MRVLFFFIFLTFSLYAGERVILLDAHLHYFPEDDGFVQKLPRPKPTYDVIDAQKFCVMDCEDDHDHDHKDTISYKEIVD